MQIGTRVRKSGYLCALIEKGQAAPACKLFMNRFWLTHSLTDVTRSWTGGFLFMNRRACSQLDLFMISGSQNVHRPFSSLSFSLRSEVPSRCFPSHSPILVAVETSSSGLVGCCCQLPHLLNIEGLFVSAFLLIPSPHSINVSPSCSWSRPSRNGRTSQLPAAITSPRA